MSIEETIVNFSANETNLLNLKVGRCVANNFDTQSLLQQITKEEYDICRLTVPADDEHAVTKLEQLGLPYYYSGSITRYKTRVSDLKENDFFHPNLEYEKYDGSQNNLLLNLLIGTWGTYPIGYYRTPFLNKLVTKEQEILCVFEFYKKHNLQKDYPSNTIMFIKHKKNYVGFFALNIIDDRLESHIGGIVDPYRKDGYFFDMQEYIRRFCVENKLTYFAFGARNENRRVNGIFQKFGYVAIDADNVFHIAPLLSFSNNKKIIKNDLVITNEDTALIYSKVLETIQKNAVEFLNNPALNYSFKISHLEGLVAGKYTTTTSFPVISDNENLAVIKLYNDQNKMVSFAYLSVSY